MSRELTEEDVMNDDRDPLEAIRELRIEQGVPEEDLPEYERPISDASDVLDAKEEEEESARGVDDDDSTSDPDNDDNSTADTSTDGGDPSGDPDVDPDSSDDSDSATDSDDDSTTAKGPVTRTFKADGKEFTFTEQEIMEQFETVFGQSMNYTQKMQKIAPYRKMISALETEGITHELLNIAIDALKGDKGALKRMMETNSIDPYDLAQDDAEEAPYQPRSYGKDDTVLAIEEITGKIQKDEEFQITRNVIDEQWDAGSRQAFAKEPRMIEALHNDIKSGVYDRVAPAAMKMKVLDGNTKSDIEYYMIAGQQFAQAEQELFKQNEGKKTADGLNEKAQHAESNYDKASSEAKRKRSATSTGARADRKGVIDYLDDDDEAFDEWYKKLNSSI